MPSPEMPRPAGKRAKDDDFDAANCSASNGGCPAERLLAATGGVPLEDGILIWIRCEEPVRIFNLSRTPADSWRTSFWIHHHADLLALMRRALALLPDAEKPPGWTP
jgi:hypothetical protein